MAARVNRQQAAAAAEVRRQQAAAAPQPDLAARAQETVDSVTGAVRRVSRPVGQVLTFPVTLGREVAADIVSTARRPDAVVYWGGLAGLVALGVLEWPAAAAVGVGVAVASGARRARA
ncbi:hypothetical protein [Geodermatophilus ruber]|uniref:Uncharacterized protein n=1 Tax=Geodermatophilus ruber TaxID=504800 RepID=A0A1I4IMZ3_9ACTN|nr:hypothetical protein [Geodermatophilus ruber]SFL55171.1 hypothetical protein SAMN04488085_11340 [Geodermatophilus ruber]